jgi:hypothetical protein
MVIAGLAAQSYTQLSRVRNWYEEPADMVAWATRNLFELDLLVRFVLKSEENMLRFLGERARDEIEILEGLISLGEDQSSRNVAILRARVDDLKRIAQKHKIRPEKHRTTRDLADAAGLRHVYDALFKLYSKYVHPSSWLVNASRQMIDEYKDAFVLEAQRYALDTLHMVSEAVRSERERKNKRG